MRIDDFLSHLMVFNAVSRPPLALSRRASEGLPGTDWNAACLRCQRQSARLRQPPEAGSRGTGPHSSVGQPAYAIGKTDCRRTGSKRSVRKIDHFSRRFHGSFYDGKRLSGKRKTPSWQTDRHPPPAKAILRAARSYLPDRPKHSSRRPAAMLLHRRMRSAEDPKDSCSLPKAIFRPFLSHALRKTKASRMK